MKVSIKRKLVKGVKLTMISYQYKGIEKNTNKLQVEREIIHTQSNAIRLQGGSWLRFDDYKASESTETENGFILDDGLIRIEYIFNTPENDNK